MRPSLKPIILRSSKSALLASIFAGAALDFNFASGAYATKSFPAASAALTTVRASSAYADDAAGNWTSFGNNVPRITNKGLLVEESRTNIIRNNSMTGAVPGTPGTLPTNGWSIFSAGGLTTNVIGVGTVNGIDYIDLQISGTTTGTFYVMVFDSVGSATSPGTVWTESFFAAIVGGSNANINSFNLDGRYTGGGAIDVAFVPTATLTRFTGTTTAPSGATAAVPGISLLFASGVAVNVTLRIGWPQHEQGAFATSPIRTTAAAVTRSADVVTVTSPPTFGSAYTLFARGTPNAPVTYTNGQGLIAASDGTTNNREAILRVSSTGFATGFSASGGTGGGTGGTVWGQGVSGSFAWAAQASDQAGSFNGGAIATFSGALPIGVNSLHVGDRGDGALQWNGYVERIIVFPSRLDNAALQTMTAGGPAFPRSDASLDIDFTQNAVYTGISTYLTTTRASVGYADDTSGNWTSFANNVPRITNKGLLVEEARTNTIRNNSMQGAIPGTPGTLPTNWTYGAGTPALSSQVVGSGVENGVDYIDFRIFGTAAATGTPIIQFENTNSAVATQGQTWTSGFFIKLVAGNLNGAVLAAGFREYDGASGLLTTQNGTLYAPTSLLIRISSSFMVASATAAFLRPHLNLNVGNGVTYDFTLRIGWPQLENNSISTGTASAVVVDGGTAGPTYAVNDILTVVGGTGTATQLKVTSVSAGLVTGVSIQVAGSYSVFPAGTVTTTGGAGSGATFTLTPVSQAANAFATSPIRTTSASVARAVEQITVTNPPFVDLSLGSALSIFSEAVGAISVGRTTLRARIDVNNYIAQQINGSNKLNTLVVSGGSNSAVLLSTPSVSVGRYKIAGAWNVNDFAQANSLEPGAVQLDNVGPVPVGASPIVYVGNAVGTLQLNGYVERVALWNSRLSNAQLQALAA